jgi:release factor glutamine methyltransferase
MTILDALTWGTEKIRETLHEKKTNAHVPSYDAQLLLAHALGERTSFLFAHGNETMKDDQWDAYRAMILRRAAHEPVSQIMQSAEFFGRLFFVNRHVLTPRSETEELVELALEMAAETDAFVDIGTGSGAIAITLALETGKPVFASDIDPRALTVAQLNSQTLEAHVEFAEGDLLEPFMNEDAPVGRITYIANLPYIPTGARRDIDPDVLSYEPHHALFSGTDGLELSMRLLRQLPKHRSFILLMELDRSNVGFFASLAKGLFPQATIEVLSDLSKKPRFFKLVHKLHR